MARTVDPAKHAARRLHIIDAALTCFARSGYERTTTAAICRAASIGSGTFFHYFPTKASVLVAILEYGTAETRAFFATLDERRGDPREAILAYVDQVVAEAADERLPGFIRAVSAVLAEPEIAAALAADDAAVRDGLLPWVVRAQADGSARTDLPAARLASWIFLLIDGFYGRLATEEGFSAAREGAMLRDAAERLMAPA